MARKFLLLLTVCANVGALVGANTAGAAPTTYPPCDSYGNQLGVFELGYNSLRDKAYLLSGASPHLLVCGAAPDPIPLDCERALDTMPDRQHIYYPPGSRVVSTQDTQVPENSYVGTSESWYVGVFVCDGYIANDRTQNLRTVDPDSTEAQPECVNTVDGEVTACYRIEAPSAFSGFVAVRRVLHQGQERLRLEISRPRVDAGVYSVAEMNLTFCNYFGPSQAQRCGTGGTPTAYNGAPSAPDCSDGRHGIFRARTHRPLDGGQWSADTLSCEPWVDVSKTDFESGLWGLDGRTK